MRCRARRPLLLTAAAALLSGCFTYVPADLATVPPGDEVRVHMSRRGMAELPEEIAGEGRTFVAGRFAGQESDSLRLRIPIAQRQVGFLTEDLRQEFRVPSAEVVQVDLRRFSYGRTALLVAGAGGAAAAVLTLITSAINSGDGGGDNPDVSLIPLFSFPVP